MVNMSSCLLNCLTLESGSRRCVASVFDGRGSKKGPFRRNRTWKQFESRLRFSQICVGCFSEILEITVGVFVKQNLL